MASLLDRITMAQMNYDGLNRVVQRTQPAPPLAKMTPLKALKPSLLSARIASASINDQELLKQNDKVGIQNRKKNQTPKIMTKLENEMVKDFEISEPTGFAVIDPATGAEVRRKFNIEGIDPPDLDRDPAGVFDGFSDRIITPDDTLEETMRLNKEKERAYQVYRDYQFQKEDLEQQLQVLTTRLNRAGSIAIPPIRREILQVEGQIARLRIAMNRTARDIDTHYDLELSRLHEGVAEHNALVSMKKQRNAEAILAYQHQLNLLNSGAFKTEKQPNETEEEYYERLRQNAEEVIPADQLEQAESKILTEFRKRIQELTKDAVKIDQISNSLTPEDKYQLIKIWKLVKERYNRAYGLTNKTIDAETIVAFLNGLVYGIEESGQLPSAVQGVISQIREEGVEALQEGELIITPYVGDNMVMVQRSNISGQPPLYIKAVVINPSARNDGGYALLYSFSGEQGTFKQYFAGGKEGGVPEDRKEGGRGGKSNDEIKQKTGITTNDLNKLVGYTFGGFNPSVVAKRLAMKYRLTAVPVAETNQSPYKTSTRHDAKEHIQYGLGIARANEPKLVQFGNVMLSLPNLKYKNILSVRTHLGKTIGGTPNIKITPKMTSIILNLLEHIQPTHEELNRLSANERQLYDRLVYLGKLHTQLPQTSDKSINELKKRLKLLEGEINIGNDSPQISSEIKHILKCLRDFNVITPKQIKEYLTKNNI